MANNDFVSYLNSLHNYNAKSENAYSEKTVLNDFYKKTAVKIALGDHIKDILTSGEPQIIILTGHAGDGKTSIMYQVLKDLGVIPNFKEKYADVKLPNGHNCRCIKDFSELSDQEKHDQMVSAFSFEKNGDYVFMVANTGPLINTFRDTFGTKEEQDSAEIDLIDVMGKNCGKPIEVRGHYLNVINIADIDNSGFANELLKLFLSDDLWGQCHGCDKESFCPILRNANLLRESYQKTSEFLLRHYVWLYEYGKRLTVRSMTEQIAFMITGGLSCDKVKKDPEYRYLFSNLFFGYIGLSEDSKADNLIGVKAAKKCHYDVKRMCADERLIIKRDYKSVFPEDVSVIVREAEAALSHSSTGWKSFLHRLYFFTNTNTNPGIDYADIFSSVYEKYLSFRCGTQSLVGYHDFDYIIDALSMIYMGAVNKNDKEIPLTLSRNGSAVQNVQLIIGEITKKKLSVKVKSTETFDGQPIRNVLKLFYDSNDLECELTLPLLVYFDELKKGVIPTNVDPQLSHGVESLKSQLSKVCGDNNDDCLKIVILKNKGNEDFALDFGSDGSIKRVQ